MKPIKRRKPPAARSTSGIRSKKRKTENISSNQNTNVQEESEEISTSSTQVQSETDSSVNNPIITHDHDYDNQHAVNCVNCEHNRETINYLQMLNVEYKRNEEERRKFGYHELNNKNIKFFTGISKVEVFDVLFKNFESRISNSGISNSGREQVD